MSSIGIKRARSLSASSPSAISRSPSPNLPTPKGKGKTPKSEPDTLDGIEAALRADTKADSPSKSKKMKLLAAHTITSPFPTHSHPTPEECQSVHDLLWKTHRTQPPKRHAPRAMANSNSAETCGGSRDVIDSLVGTILSQNTNNRNSTGAKKSLDAAFGRYKWETVATAPRADVVEALKHGGLANKKAAVIQNVLTAIHQKHGSYSLQHLAEPGLSDEDVMKELVSYDGVGPKTAGCVLMFCLGRDAFAVDTHIFRLSHVLGWVPLKADRVLTQAHLDLKIPDELKYGLHVLMIQHGKACSGCKGKSNGTTKATPKGKGKAKAKVEEDVDSDEVDELKSEGDEKADVKVEEKDFKEGVKALKEKKPVLEPGKCVLKTWLREHRQTSGPKEEEEEEMNLIKDEDEMKLVKEE